MYKWPPLILGIIMSTMVFGQTGTRLAAPVPNSTRSILQPTGNPLCFDFRMEGAEIRYTTKQTNPTSNSTVFTKDTVWVTRPKVFRARGFHPDFLPSEVVEVAFIRPGIKIDSLSVNAPSMRYQARGAATLFDQNLADGSYTKDCLGFSGEKADIQLFFTQKTKVRKLSVSVAINQGAWIFCPAKITIFDIDGKVLCSRSFAAATPDATQKFTIFSLNFHPKMVTKLRVVVEPLDTLPKWHPGFPSKPWIFIDEVLIH